MQRWWAKGARKPKTRGAQWTLLEKKGGRSGAYAYYWGYEPGTHEKKCDNDEQGGGGDKEQEDHDDHEHKEGGEKMVLLLDHFWIMMNLSTTFGDN